MVPLSDGSHFPYIWLSHPHTIQMTSNPGKLFPCVMLSPPSVGKVTLAAEGEIYINLGSKITPRANTD